MSAKNPAEARYYGYNLTWPQARALLLFLYGLKINPVSDFGPVEEIETKIGTGDLSPKSTEFPDFNAIFKKP